MNVGGKGIAGKGMSSAQVPGVWHWNGMNERYLGREFVDSFIRWAVRLASGRQNAHVGNRRGRVGTVIGAFVARRRREFLGQVAVQDGAEGFVVEIQERFAAAGFDHRLEVRRRLAPKPARKPSVSTCTSGI